MLDVVSPAATRLRPPRWFDARLLVGIGLMLGSVVIGTRVVAAAGDSDRVWQVNSDLAAGTPLTDDDLRVVEVRLSGGAAAQYLDAARAKPVGWVVTRAIGRHELLPLAALAAPGVAAQQWRIVTVPVARFHYPGDLAKGEQVDVYLSRADPQSPRPEQAEPELVLSAVTVARVDGTPGSGLAVSSASSVGVELAVPVQDAAALVGAIQSGALDLVRVPSVGTDPR